MVTIVDRCLIMTNISAMFRENVIRDDFEAVNGLPTGKITRDAQMWPAYVSLAYGLVKLIL
jgi:hypothetical protein